MLHSAKNRREVGYTVPTNHTHCKCISTSSKQAHVKTLQQGDSIYEIPFPRCQTEY